MSRIRLPCQRDVQANLDEPDAETDACVVACPPHPQHGGNRSDSRLRAVADGLAERGVASLRFDYGPWAEGRGERLDAECALDWARERYERVALFGYSFGAAVALVVAADRDDFAAVAAVAPGADLPDGSDTASAVERIRVPTLIVYGERDDTVDWQGVVGAAEAAGHTAEGMPADHHFVGQTADVAERITAFLSDRL